LATKEDASNYLFLLYFGLESLQPCALRDQLLLVFLWLSLKRTRLAVVQAFLKGVEASRPSFVSFAHGCFPPLVRGAVNLSVAFHSGYKLKDEFAEEQSARYRRMSFIAVLPLGRVSVLELLERIEQPEQDDSLMRRHVVRCHQSPNSPVVGSIRQSQVSQFCV
jgi:hypothetical protein